MSVDPSESAEPEPDPAEPTVRVPKRRGHGPDDLSFEPLVPLPLEIRERVALRAIDHATTSAEALDFLGALGLLDVVGLPDEPVRSALAVRELARTEAQRQRRAEARPPGQRCDLDLGASGTEPGSGGPGGPESADLPAAVSSDGWGDAAV